MNVKTGLPSDRVVELKSEDLKGKSLIVDSSENNFRVVTSVVSTAGVKQFVRNINRQGPTNIPAGLDSIQDVDKELGEWVAKGYHLQSSHFIAATPEYFSMLYVLVHD